MEKTYFDIFAGIGLVDYALESNGWSLSLALDYEPKKHRIFRAQFNGLSSKYRIADIFALSPKDLPKSFLGHASFPCTDVSNAGRRIGVQNGNESSAIDSLLGTLYSKSINERPEILLTENVKGLLTSNRGQDIRYLLQHFNKLGYSNDLLLLDARHFVPQSRERVFIVSLKKNLRTNGLTQKVNNLPEETWMRPKAILKVVEKNQDLEWCFLRDLNQPKPTLTLSDIIDMDDTVFWSRERTEYLYSQMSDKHQNWINERINDQDYSYGTAFRRMRMVNGIKQSRAEIRVDQIAGCLRTAKGGSAKQILFRVGRGSLNVRLINAIEAARLMGAPNFQISDNISLNDYLFGFGDGVCSSVISWLDKNYLTPLYHQNENSTIITEIKKPSMKKLSKEINDQIVDSFKSWAEAHKDSHTGLPIKGRLYGALVVLHNLATSKEDEAWGFKNTLEVNSTDKGDHFGDRSIKNHTSHKINLALSTLGRSDLIPSSGGEAGRTSTGTKKAGLEIIQIVNSITGASPKADIRKIGLAVVEKLNDLIIDGLERHKALGGIEVTFTQGETIGSFISKIIHFPSNNPGAILQHLVGTKLELRYSKNQ